MVVYLIGGFCVGAMMRPTIDKMIRNYVNRG